MPHTSFPRPHRTTAVFAAVVMSSSPRMLLLAAMLLLLVLSSDAPTASSPPPPPGPAGTTRSDSSSTPPPPPPGPTSSTGSQNNSDSSSTPPPPPPGPASSTGSQNKSDARSTKPPLGRASSHRKFYDEAALVCDFDKLGWELASHCETATIGCCETVIFVITVPGCFCMVCESEPILEHPYLDDENVYSIYLDCGGSAPIPHCPTSVGIVSPPLAPGAVSTLPTPPPPAPAAVSTPPPPTPPVVVTLPTPPAAAPGFWQTLRGIAQQAIYIIFGAFCTCMAMWGIHLLHKYCSVRRARRSRTAASPGTKDSRVYTVSDELQSNGNTKVTPPMRTGSEELT